MSKNLYFSSLRSVLIKISGEGLMGGGSQPLDAEILRDLVVQIQEILEKGVHVALLVGGGNFFRGVSGQTHNIARTTGDAMGMMATVMNGLALQNAFQRENVGAAVFCSFPLPFGIQPYNAPAAQTQMKAGNVVILVGGTGHPFFTTDTAAVLRALELDCDALLKATKVKGVYSADPLVFSEAVFYPFLTYDQVLSQNLKIMDGTAIALAQENQLPLVVFSMAEENGLRNVFQGKGQYSLIQNSQT